MAGKLALLTFCPVIAGIYAYRALEYHHVSPMSTSRSDVKQYVPIPVSASNRLDYSLYQQTLSQFVTHDGKVKYVDLRKSMMRDKQKTSTFIQWLHVLSQTGPNTTPSLFIDKDEQLKYYINAYNALTIYGVIHHSFYHKNQHSIISSVMDVKSLLEPVAGWGFFKAPMYTLDGNMDVSLYDLENTLIRAQFGDARIHCAINCASAGCPMLQPHVISVEELDELCEQFVNNESNVSVDSEGKKVHLSQIFEWYASDFDQFYDDSKSEEKIAFNTRKLFYFLWKYASEDNALKEKLSVAIQEKYDIEWIKYDWSLNNVPTTRIRAIL